jgi:hypothetical protein
MVLTDGRQQQHNHNTVNTICGRIIIGSSLSSVSKHNMWSYYHWVIVVVVEDNDNPIIIRPTIVFIDGRKQRQPNHNTTTYSRIDL